MTPEQLLYMLLGIGTPFLFLLIPGVLEDEPPKPKAYPPLRLVRPDQPE